MSSFAVKVCRLATVSAHPDSAVERLALATLTTSDYRFVVQKNTYQAGDLVIYFPLDSILPDSIIETLGLTGKLAGSAHNRVKTIRLRGEISQGLVASPTDLLSPDELSAIHEGDDLTERLGVTKYEPPVIVENFGRLVPLPHWMPVYDIENAENFAAQVAALMDQPVVITEKVEGSHWAMTIDTGGTISVAQRNYLIEPTGDGEHSWHKAAQATGLRDKIAGAKAAVEARLGHPISTLTMRGELLGPGIQSNIYKLTKHNIRLFEMEADGQPIDSGMFLAVCRALDLPYVPVLWEGRPLREWLGDKTLRQASNGQSMLSTQPLLREGVVIKPTTEQRDRELGRVFLKQRSPDYLASEK